jgi:hypothetical protein
MRHTRKSELCGEFWSGRLSFLATAAKAFNTKYQLLSTKATGRSVTDRAITFEAFPLYIFWLYTPLASYSLSQQIPKRMTVARHSTEGLYDWKRTQRSVRWRWKQTDRDKR